LAAGGTSCISNSWERQFLLPAVLPASGFEGSMIDKYQQGLKIIVTLAHEWRIMNVSIRCLPRFINANCRLLNGIGVSRADLRNQRQT
jgi:hypothetical protein